MNLCNSPGNHGEDDFFLFVIQFWCVTFTRTYHSLMTYSTQGYASVKGEKSQQNKVVWREKLTVREKFWVTLVTCGSFPLVNPRVSDWPFTERKEKCNHYNFSSLIWL